MEKNVKTEIDHKIYKDGIVIRSGDIINGKKEGVWYIYSDNGKVLLAKEIYVNGERKEMIRYHFTRNFPKDEKEREEFCKENSDKSFKNRKIYLKGEYLNNLPCGVWEEYDEDSDFVSKTGRFEECHPHKTWFNKIKFEDLCKNFDLPELNLQGEEDKDYCFYEQVTFHYGKIQGEYKVYLCTGNVKDRTSLTLLVEGFKSNFYGLYGILHYELDIDFDSGEYLRDITIYNQKGEIVSKKKA